jgi:hypothetical protein
MVMQTVEYEFPDPDKGEGSKKGDREFEIEGAVGRMDPLSDKVIETTKHEDIEVETEVDEPEVATPKVDRDRMPNGPPEELTDAELGTYANKVKKRLQHFSRGYHDERRAKEEAVREREELRNYAKLMADENAQLKGSVNKSHTALVEHAKKAVETEVAEARRMYKEAYEAGDSDALVTAQESLTTARLRMERVQNIKVPPLQERETQVQAPPRQAAAPSDPRATAWAKKNTWFGDENNPEMTAYALGLDTKLKREGIDPGSDVYYEKLDSRLRQIFPEQFSDEDVPSESPQRRKSSSVVAPATRSTAPKRVTLSPSQQARARGLGVTMEQYAAQVAELERKQNG